MVSKKDLLILSELRRNSRESLTRISRRTSIPISTIFDKLRHYEDRLIDKHTSIIDFSELGFNTRAHIIIKVEKHERDIVKDFLSKHHSVNSVYKINNGFDFMFETVFVNIKDMEDFIESFEQRFSVLAKNVHYIIQDVKKESFMADPIHLDMVFHDADLR